MFREILNWFGELFNWFFCVAPWEQAIRVRFGKHVRKLDAGFYVRIPFIDKVFKQSVRRRLHTIKVQTLTTKDGRIITCAGAIGFEVNDLLRLYNTLESPNETINCEVAGVVADFVGNRNLNDCKVSDLEAYVSENIDLSKYGLCGQEFYIMSFATTARTYRLITGEIPLWNQDRMMDMDESKGG